MSVIDAKPAYSTALGSAFCGDSLDLLAKLPDSSVNLFITSPPFALQREKEDLDRSGNKSQGEYVEWLAQFGCLVYTPKKRPSGHDIAAAFGKDNGGAIP